MPRYTFKDTNSEEIFTRYMSSESKEKYLQEHPHIIQPLCAPGIGDSVRLGIRKPDGSYYEALSKVKEAHPINDIET